MKLWQKTRVTYLDWPISLLSTHLLERCSWNIQCSFGYRPRELGRVTQSGKRCSWNLQWSSEYRRVRARTVICKWRWPFSEHGQLCVSFSTNLMIGLPESISPSFFITCMYRVRLILTRLTILSGFTWTRGCWIVSQPIIADKLQHTIWLIACRDKEC